jgi:hypothetical protein
LAIVEHGRRYRTVPMRLCAAADLTGCHSDRVSTSA